jgi:hypothetical protein
MLRIARDTKCLTLLSRATLPEAGLLSRGLGRWVVAAMRSCPRAPEGRLGGIGAAVSLRLGSDCGGPGIAAATALGRTANGSEAA